jgi:deoxyinosine 3'endonuclease (endonuclease V)
MCSFNLTQIIADIQSQLAMKVVEEDIFEKLERVAGADVSFSVGERAVAAAVVLEMEDLEVVEEQTLPVELFFPYIPGFLGFRESGAVVDVLNTLKSDFDVLMVNGHGVMHPRGFGLASQVGVLMEKSTIGVAKRLIKGTYINQATRPYHQRTSVQFIKNADRVMGAYFRGKYISVGHYISLKTALNVLESTSIYKTPEPIRKAHILATETFKSDLD